MKDKFLFFIKFLTTVDIRTNYGNKKFYMNVIYINEKLRTNRQLYHSKSSNFSIKTEFTYFV